MMTSPDRSRTWIPIADARARRPPRRAMASALAVAVIGCGGAPTGPTATEPPSNAGGTAPVAPDLDGLRAALEPHAQLRFDAAARTRGCPEDQTLGAYVTMLVVQGEARGAAEAEVHHLTGSCGGFPAQPIPIDPAPVPGTWYCRIDAYRSDPEGESPWHYELRLRVRMADGAPDLASLACPGSA